MILFKISSNNTLVILLHTMEEITSTLEYQAYLNLNAIPIEGQTSCKLSRVYISDSIIHAYIKKI